MTYNNESPSHIQLYPRGDDFRISPWNKLTIFQGGHDGTLLDIKQHLPISTLMKDLVVGINQDYIDKQTEWLPSYLYFSAPKNIIAVVHINHGKTGTAGKPYKEPKFIRSEKILKGGQLTGDNQWELDPQPIERLLTRANFLPGLVVARYGEEIIPRKRPFFPDHYTHIYQPGVGIIYLQLKYLPEEILRQQRELDDTRNNHQRIEISMEEELAKLQERLKTDPSQLY